MPYVEEMQTRLGTKMRHEVCERDLDHAFVLRQSEEVAEITAKWIQEEDDR